MLDKIREYWPEMVYNSKLRELATGQYLTNPENENFQYIKNRFFPKNTVKETQTLITWSNLFNITTSLIAKHTWNPSLDLYFPTRELVKDYLTFGFATFSLEREEWKLKVVYIPAEKTFKNWNSDAISRYFEKEKNDWTFEYYYLETLHFNGLGCISNSLYKLEWKIAVSPSAGLSSLSKMYLKNATQVPLDTLTETSNLEDFIETWLDKTFFRIEQNSINTELSLVEQLKPIVYSIDRKINMLEQQYLQNTESYIMYKGIKPPRYLTEIANGTNWGEIDLSRFWKHIFTDNTDASIEFINNENKAIASAREYIREQYEEISSKTWIPLDYLTSGSRVWSIGEASRLLLHWNFFETIKDIRNLIDEHLETLILILKKEKVWDLTYSWDELTTQTSTQKVDELLSVASLGLLPKVTLLKRYLGYSIEEAEELLKLKEKEEVLESPTEETKIWFEMS